MNNVAFSLVQTLLFEKQCVLQKYLIYLKLKFRRIQSLEKSRYLQTPIPRDFGYVLE